MGETAAARSRMRARRKQRRSQIMGGASGLVALLPAVEFFSRHETWQDVGTPGGLAHAILLAVGVWGIVQSRRLYQEGETEATEATADDAADTAEDLT